MTALPLVSVVIPAYNAERFLADALASVQRQAGPLEIIVLDDGSTDGTRQIAEQWPPVRYFWQANGGIGAARNAGVARASGELLAFLDADDLWTGDKLQRQREVLAERPEIDLVSGQVEQFFDASLAVPPGASPPPTSDAFSAGSMLVRRAAFDRIGPFRTDLKVGEVIDWHSRATSGGLAMLILPHIVLRRRIHGNNTVLRLRGEYSSYLSMLKSHLNRKRQAASAPSPVGRGLG
jgi:glycosyltransferase involved in cell wall biosynthesis